MVVVLATFWGCILGKNGLPAQTGDPYCTTKFHEDPTCCSEIIAT